MHGVISRVLVITAVAAVPAAAQQRAASPAASQPAAPSGAQQAGERIDSRADVLMHRMSDYLTGLGSFKVDTRAVDEVVLQSGQKLDQLTESRLSVVRPNRAHSQRIGPADDVDFRYDGRTFSIASGRRGYYASAPAPSTLDQAVDVLRDRYGMDIPAADLILSRPYEAMMQDVQSGIYLGMEPIGGVQTHHLAFSGPDVDWQIWIRDGDQPLPVRLVITSKTERSQPQFAVDLYNWRPNPPIAANEFEFTPAPGARRIQILPSGSANARDNGGR